MYGVANEFQLPARCRISAMQRNLPVANGGLLEVHLGSSQQAVVNFTFAAIAVARSYGHM
jgi:hypothetical protein